MGIIAVFQRILNAHRSFVNFSKNRGITTCFQFYRRLILIDTEIVKLKDIMKMGKEHDRGWRGTDGFFRANKPPSGSFGEKPEIRKTTNGGSLPPREDPELSSTPPDKIIIPRASHASIEDSFKPLKPPQRTFTVFTSISGFNKLDISVSSATSAKGKLLAPSPRLEEDFNTGKISFAQYE